MALVELWRADSWAPPMLGCGAEVLSLLRTDSEAAVAASVPSPLPATRLHCASSALTVLRGTASRTQLRTQTRLSSASREEPASTRSPAPAVPFAPRQRHPRPGAAVPLPPADRTATVTGKVIGTEARQELPPLPMDVGLLGEEPLFPQMWDDDALPEDTAWMFDPAADPLSEPNTSVLDELAGPYGCGALCDPSDEPASPVSVFYADGCNSESCPSSDDDQDNSDDYQESAKPESSDVSGATAMDSGIDSSSRLLNDTAFGPTVAVIESALDEEESPAPPMASRKRTRAVGSAPVESNSVDSEPEVPIRESSSRTSKKARKAPQPVKNNPKTALAKGKGKGRQSCLQCFTFSTPQWREGPQGARTLCNACGVRYRKQLNLAKKAKACK
jgi:hypothetical protein|uniref:GATA-type domain-containing protein n=1 Tax=Tetraselmis chuii TaxID=63592 RepID=A0A7S1SWL9_9CHLO|mmetsp:Transcript_32152/g.57571  ORF Transcript_32152/g.57571 Transcript_32152/m.57571 type:complete len:389 (+) Transcript_32152:165-1331(+)